MQMISEAIRELPRANVDFHDGLTVEYARQRGIRTAVRGLRAVTDFENEFAMALTNRSLWPEFDTVFLMTKAEYMYLSSSVVRQVSEMGGDVGQFVPPCVERHRRGRGRVRERRQPLESDAAEHDQGEMAVSVALLLVVHDELIALGAHCDHTGCRTQEGSQCTRAHSGQDGGR